MTDAADPTTDSKSKAEAKGAMYHCDYCRKDISSTIRIKCAECNDFDLCVECFASGCAVYPHKPDHPYRVMDLVKKPVYTLDWGADEELLLLEGIEMFGMGNWGDVADHVGTKTKTECENHYQEIYLTSKTAPIPDPSRAIGAVKTDTDVQMKLESTTPPTTAKQTKLRQHAPSKPKPKTGLGHLVGYTPSRGDFDVEYENDAELVLADMEFKDDVDTKWERDLKLKVLEIYCSKLDARMERKKFILERGLLERKEKKRSKEEREVYNNFRVFARFHSAEEHEAFIQGLLNEQRLRKRIEQLQQYRLNGIRTLAEGELYDAEKRRREQNQLTALSAGNKIKIDLKGKKRPAEGGVGGTGVDDGIKVKKQDTKVSEWDISKMPGQELLDAQEKNLCTTLQLLPQHYIMIKDRLIKECFSRGFLKEGQAKQLIKIDVNKTAKIFDFFVSVGWLNTQDMINANNAKQGTMSSATPSPAISSAQPPSASPAPTTASSPSKTKNINPHNNPYPATNPPPAGYTSNASTVPPTNIQRH